jgi:hypothetical protein
VRRIFLGDSYDLVKRFWSEGLRSVAPLYAHPQFVPEEIRPEYTAITSVPVLDTDRLPDKPFGVLLDPDTGIPFPSESRARARRSHAPLPFIVGVHQDLRPLYVVCFDQSYHRRQEASRQQQLEKKREFLRQRGLSSFYYQSHAPFLFTADDVETLTAIRSRLVSLGIPQDRLAFWAEARRVQST